VLIQAAVVREQAQLVIDLRAVVVDRDELLVQVLERGARRPQPVLEDADVRGVRLRRLDLRQRLHGEGDVGCMLVGAQRSRRCQLGIRGRALDDVTPGDDDVVGSAEQVQCRFLEAGFGAGCAGADLGELFHVRASDGIGQILLGPLHDLAGWRKPWFSRQYSADTISNRLPKRRNSATESFSACAGTRRTSSKRGPTSRAFSGVVSR
jgi:hypothetical protein